MINFSKKSRINDVRITPDPTGGFIVQVGCAYIGYTNIKALCSDLEEYLNDPEGVRKQYNNFMDGPEVATRGIGIELVSVPVTRKSRTRRKKAPALAPDAINLGNQDKL